MKFKPEIQQPSIVLLGNFNPAMFHPLWFVKNGVMSEEDASYAQQNTGNNLFIVTPQITIFRTYQYSIKIELTRFQVIAEKEPYNGLLDFISKTFESLEGIDIRAYGINYSADYAIDTVSEYQRIADNIAPKSYWESLLKDETSGDERQSGLLSIQMRKNFIQDGKAITVTLQPSVLIQPGILLSTNYHRDVKDDLKSAYNVMNAIRNNYHSTLDEIKNIHNDILEKAAK